MALKFLKVTLLIVSVVGTTSTYACALESTKFVSHLSKLLKKPNSNPQLVEIQSNKGNYINEEEGKKFIEDRTEKAFNINYERILDLNNQVQQSLKRVVENMDQKNIQELTTLFDQLKNYVQHAKGMEKDYMQSQEKKDSLDRAVEKKNKIDKIERYVQENFSQFKFLEEAPSFIESGKQLEKNLNLFRLNLAASQNKDEKEKDFLYDILGENIRPD